MLIEGTTLSLPSATKDLPDRILNLGEILTAEARQREVAMVTPVKAPELLYTFNYAWLETDKLVKGLAADLVKAKAQVEKRKARILLYEAEDFLKTRNVASTKDSRDAVIVLDPEYETLQDRVDQIFAAQEWLKGKMKSFENSYSSVKKIMGEDAYDMSTRINNPNLSGGGSQKPFSQPRPPQSTPAPTTTPTPAPTTNPPKTGYGKPRYDR
jgi:hypothetical protein